jgi:hypothetical protein
MLRARPKDWQEEEREKEWSRGEERRRGRKGRGGGEPSLWGNGRGRDEREEEVGMEESN